jgi:hypothetical protein
MRKTLVVLTLLAGCGHTGFDERDDRPAIESTPVQIDVGYDIALRDDLKLVARAVLIDGEAWQEGLRPLTIGQHRLKVNVEVSPRSADQVTRFSSEQAFVIPPELAGKALTASFTVRLSDTGAIGRVPERVRLGVDARPVTRLERR